MSSTSTGCSYCCVHCCCFSHCRVHCFTAFVYCVHCGVHCCLFAAAVFTAGVFSLLCAPTRLRFTTAAVLIDSKYFRLGLECAFHGSRPHPRVGSRRSSKSHESGQFTVTRPSPTRGLTWHVNSPGQYVEINWRLQHRPHEGT